MISHFYDGLRNTVREYECLLLISEAIAISYKAIIKSATLSMNAIHNKLQMHRYHVIMHS